MTDKFLPHDAQTTILAIITQELSQDAHLKSVKTRRDYLGDLTSFETWRAARPLSRLLVEEYVAELQAAGRSLNTINRMLAAVRWWARRLAHLTQEDLLLLPGQGEILTRQASQVLTVNDVKGSRPPKGQHLTEGDLARLMQTCELDSHPAGMRDGAIFALAWSTGASRNEIAGLHLSDLIITSHSNPASTHAEESGKLLIKGKGDMERVMDIFNGTLLALVDWLTVRGRDPGLLFCVIARGNKIHPGRPLSGEDMRLILNRRIKQAGIKPLTWHDFRRTFASYLLDSGNDLVTVQKMMGHASILTTRKYDRGDEEKFKAVRSLFVPYHERKH